MAAINFPDSPSNGTTHTAGDTTWTYNSTKGVWEINSANSFVASSSSYSNADVTAHLASFDGSIIPAANVTYDLGSATNRFRDLYISGNSINLGDVQLSANNGGLAVTSDSGGGNTASFATQDYVTTQIAAKANTADLATVATSGSYTDLTGTPTGGSGVTTYTAKSGTDGTPAGATYIDNVSSPSEGDLAYDLAADQLYVRTTSAWKRVALGVDETPFVTTEPATSHDLNTDGSTSTMTMVAYDPEGFDVSYGISYNTPNNARPSQLSSDTTINQTTGVYTFTPSTSNFGSFKARLSASDGARMTTRTVDVRLLREVTFAQSTGFFTADSTNGGTFSYTGVTSSSTNGGGGVSNALDVRDTTGASSFYLEVEFQDISTGDDPAIWLYPSFLGSNRGYEEGKAVSLLSNGNDGNGYSTGLSSISNGDRVMLMWTHDRMWLGKNGTWSSRTGSPNGSHQNGTYAWTNMYSTGGPYIAFGSHSSTASNYTFTIHGNGSTNYTTGFGTGGTHTTVVY